MGEKPLKTAVVFTHRSNTGLKPGANEITALKTIGILKTGPLPWTAQRTVPIIWMAADLAARNAGQGCPVNHQAGSLTYIFRHALSRRMS
jgi:hypothetical protein